MAKSIYDILGPEGYAKLYPDHLASAEADVADWSEQLNVLGLPQSGRLLDVGCGLGERTAAWAKRGYDVVGIDCCTPLLAAAREQFPELTFQEVSAREAAKLGRFDAVTAHFNFLMLMPMIQIMALLGELRSCIAPGGVFVTDVSSPRGMVPAFKECWSFGGRTLLEFGSPLEDGYQHQWFESGREICRERFWFRSRETYEALARSSGWSVRILDWKADESTTYDLMIFQ